VRELTGHDRNTGNVAAADYLQADIERWIGVTGVAGKMNIRSGDRENHECRTAGPCDNGRAELCEFEGKRIYNEKRVIKKINE
jgi:hypothetical protein